MHPWTFVHVADIQTGSPKSYRFNPGWKEHWVTARQQIAEIDPDLLLVGGDLTRDGCLHRYELEEKKTELDALPCPSHVVPGNMDTGNKHTHVAGLHRRHEGQSADVDLNVTSEQLQAFASVFGPLQWSLVHKNVRFSGFPDMVLGSGLPEEEAFWTWAEALKTEPRAEHHVWIMHYAVFVDEVREANWDITKQDEYKAWYFSISEPHRSRLVDLFKATGTDLVISGHIHCHKAFEVEGIRYEIAPATCFAQWGDRWPDGDPTLGFLRYDVSDGGIASTLVPLRKTVDWSDRAYGPGGHPAPDQRDYSLAWEPGGNPNATA